MAYQENTESILNGATTMTVTFPTPFASAPDVIIPVVLNTSGDSPKLQILAVVTGKSNSQFSVEFDVATDTANYQLTWIAGSATLLFQAITLGFKKASQLEALQGTPEDEDFIISVQAAPVARTRKLYWSQIFSLFCQSQSTPPSDPSDPGEVNEISSDADYLYIHNGISWGRVAINSLDWAPDESHKVTQSGIYSIANGVSLVEVTFPTAFDTTPPMITFSVENQAVGNYSLLFGVVRERTVSGFKVQLSAPTDSINYKLYWEAKQP